MSATQLVRTAFVVTVAIWNSLAQADGADPAASLPNAVQPGNDVAGVGVALGIDHGQLVVHRVLADTPAARNGLIHNGDRLLAVGQGTGAPVSVKGMSIQQTVSMIRGTKGTVVALTIVPAGKADADAIVVPLTRGTIKELNRFGDGRWIPRGSDAADFRAISLTNGEQFELKKERGKILVLEFWFVGCGPCLTAIDKIQKLREEHPEWKDRVHLVAVGVDDDKQAALRCVQERKARWAAINLVWAGPEVLKTFHIDALPAVYVLDERGRVLAADDRADLSRVIKNALPHGSDAK